MMLVYIASRTLIPLALFQMPVPAFGVSPRGTEAPPQEISLELQEEPPAAHEDVFVGVELPVFPNFVFGRTDENG
jgi:hypothetical protein